MGMFDFIRCEMPLPEPAPPKGLELQTKDTPEQYLEPYRITADGRLVYEKRERVREGCDETSSNPVKRLGHLRTISTQDVEIPYHGDIGFCGSDSRTGERWDYTARFTEDRCVRIWLEEYQPPTRAPIEFVAAPGMSPADIIAGLKAAGFVFRPGHDTTEDARLDGPHEFVRDPDGGSITYRMWVPTPSLALPASAIEGGTEP